MALWHETDRLALDRDGNLFLKTLVACWEPTVEDESIDHDEVLEPLGPVEDAAHAAEEHGASAEYDELVDLWRDADDDYAGQVRSDYQRQQGY